MKFLFLTHFLFIILNNMSCIGFTKVFTCCLFNKKNKYPDVHFDDLNKEISLKYKEVLKKNNFESTIDSKKKNDIFKLLQHIDYKGTIPFVPPIYYGKVVKVYDGDTITIAGILPGTCNPIYRFSVRLLGIDTPEIKGNTEEEKRLAKVARDELSNLILNKFVELKNISTEKYGRILADVYFEEIHVNKWLLEKGFAVEYNGGTKIRPDSWN